MTLTSSSTLPFEDALRPGSPLLDPGKRHDFVLVFQVKDGNPNGDPDAANRPRMDARTGLGRVTDASVKRKVRDFVKLVKQDADRYRIFIERDAPLNATLRRNYEANGLMATQEADQVVTDAQLNALTELVEELPPAFSLDEDTRKLTYDGSLDSEELKALWSDLKGKATRDTLDLLKNLVKRVGKSSKNRESEEKAREHMLQQYFDVRMFGATMDTGSHKAGKVKGALQIHMGNSVHPIEAVSDSLARVVVTKEEDAHKRTTFGERWSVPYGAYVVTGQYSPHSDAAPFVTEDDLSLFWTALVRMYDNHRSHSTGTTSTLRVVVFTHDDPLGNAPSFLLHESVRVEARTETPRSRRDIEIRHPEPGAWRRGITVTVFDPAS
ncbi:type I CRISPR-associated protein Cas7 [Deinococcus yavapaiensis]|uniref:CRISPR-associated Csd2 family protein n=1 Tax=Deinococcus yavapaiensis KR-236 TaxID=694435 RepID=A0A318S8V5_9DEIO|nr:type I CRISPR-associated protein Cas7 [Deinococcus yavapaiensis]PYE55477.1 CRISPR-associated Csd2 family protein [Deinococcus yavapaiensis KR-236]